MGRETKVTVAASSLDQFKQPNFALHGGGTPKKNHKKGHKKWRAPEELQQREEYRWLQLRPDNASCCIEGKDKLTAAQASLACPPVGPEALPVDSPCDYAGSKQPSEDSPFALKVAGRDWRAAVEDERWNCSEDYPFIQARCHPDSPLGMSEDLLFDSTRSPMDQVPEEMRQAVLIRGLPNELCIQPSMQVVLEQAGLKGHIVDCRYQQGEHRGECLVWLDSQNLLDYAVWHFHGCCWAKYDSPVTACIVKTAPMPPSAAEISAALAEKVLAALQAPPEEFLIDSDGNYILAGPVLAPDIVPPPLKTPRSPTVGTERLSTIWEEEKCSEITAEVSTDAGASGSGASEAEDCHEGDESSE